MATQLWVNECEEQCMNSTASQVYSLLYLSHSAFSVTPSSTQVAILLSSSTLSSVSEINRPHWGRRWRRKSSVGPGSHFPKLYSFWYILLVSLPCHCMCACLQTVSQLSINILRTYWVNPNSTPYLQPQPYCFACCGEVLGCPDSLLQEGRANGPHFTQRDIFIFRPHTRSIQRSNYFQHYVLINLYAFLYTFIS